MNYDADYRRNLEAFSLVMREGHIGPAKHYAAAMLVAACAGIADSYHADGHNDVSHAWQHRARDAQELLSFLWTAGEHMPKPPGWTLEDGPGGPIVRTAPPEGPLARRLAREGGPRRTEFPELDVQKVRLDIAYGDRRNEFPHGQEGDCWMNCGGMPHWEVGSHAPHGDCDGSVHK